ncbi:MAG: DUF3617 family protein [Terracidiphilus sp.]
MRKTRLWIPAGCCAVVTAMLLMAQPSQRPGLYETTSTMTWQQSPFPQGMQMPGGGASPFGGGPHTQQVCITQEMINRYGGASPQQSPRSQCHMANVNKTATGMTGDWVCTGQMNGTGHITTTWSGDGTTTTKVHFTGNMQMGPRSTPVEWTNDSTSAYKGPDCGSVKPIQMPAQ